MSTVEPPDRPDGENRPMPLARITWSITAAVFFVFGAALVIEGYLGYAVVTLVISLAAGINLL